MADEQHRAVEAADQLLEQLERLDVEIVGRLVEHEHVRRPGKQPRQHQAVALAAGQRADGRLHALARKQKIREIADDVARLAVDDDGGVALVDAVGERRVGIELLALLIEVGHLQPCAVAHFAAVRAPSRRRAAAEASSFPIRSDRSGRRDRRAGCAASSRGSTTRPPNDFDTRSASNTSFPEPCPSSTARRTVPDCARYAARSARSAISARTRPSLRVRRALTPWRSHASSFSSFLSSRSSSRASASRAASFFCR